MSMLEAGGMPLLTDNIRTADEDNPKGYFEFERVKQIDQDWSWLEDARGKAVKIISELLMRLPQDVAFRYKVIFMQRKMEEILASQRQMLIRRGEPVDTASDGKLAILFGKHLKRVEAWISQQPNVELIYVNYHDVLGNPAEQADRVNQFLGNRLDVQKMVEVVDRALHRQRA
jgi:hypothetical protein